MLRDQQMSFLNLQQKADTKLRDARHIQDKMMGQCNLYLFKFCKYDIDFF